MSEDDREQEGDESQDSSRARGRDDGTRDGDPPVDVPLSDLKEDIAQRRGQAPPSDEVPPADVDVDEADSTGEESSGDRAGPLSDLRNDIEERRRERRESPPEVDEAFQAASSEPVIDGEQVWEDLIASDEEMNAGLAFGESVADESADVRIIPKRICHNCTYFGDPPEVHCEHDGTEIRRVVDMSHFEVVDCPVVKNRSDLAGQ